MSAPARPAGGSEHEPFIPLYFVAALGALAGLPALLAGLALEPLARRRPRPLVIAAGVGLGLAVALSGVARGQAARALDALVPPGGLLAHGPDLAAAWPALGRWWALTLPVAPALAFLLDLARPKTLEQQRERRQAREQRTRQRREDKARRHAARPAPEPRADDKAQPALPLGRPVGGDPVLPVRQGWAHLEAERLALHLVVLGASGSGKTETLLRVAWGAARHLDWDVIFIDAKGDETTQQRFHALMHDAGRPTRLFPREPYDGWRGEPYQIANRLFGLIDFADEGGGTFYRDTAMNLVRLAVEAPGGPPGSARELLGRLNRNKLAGLWAGHPEAQDIVAYTPRQVDEARQRYQSFFRALHGQLDGTWAFEDTQAGYLLLNELVLGEETAKLARFLIEDFKQYVAARKARGRRVLLIVDEFSGIAEDTHLARVVETVRSYGAAVVLAPQVTEGMGGPDAAARILGSVGTVLLHRIPDPDQTIRLAGTRIAFEASHQHEHGRATGLGSARLQHQHKIDPNQVRALPTGQAFLIAHGQAAHLQIAQAPSLPLRPLPPPPPAPAPVAPPPTLPAPAPPPAEPAARGEEPRDDEPPPPSGRPVLRP